MALTLDLRDGIDPLRELTGRYLDAVARTDSDLPFGCYFIAPDSEYAPLARFVERSVFLRRFANDDRTMDSEYDRYEAGSQFIVVIDHSVLEPVAMLRRILPNPHGLKTLNDLETTPGWQITLDDIRACHGDVRRETTMEVATIAVRAEWSTSRGSLAVAALFYTAYLGMILSGMKHEICALDTRAKETKLIGDLAFDRICDLPAVEYLGSASTAPYIADIEKSLWIGRTVDNPLVRMICRGEGLDEFSFPAIDLTLEAPLDPTSLESQGDRVGTGATALP